MANTLAVYYDSNGLVCKIVDIHHEDPNYVPTNSDHAPHDDAATLRALVPLATYAANPPINWGGVPVYHGLTKAVLPQISAANAAIGTAAQKIADAVDTALANRSAAEKAAATAYADFTASLTAQQQAQFDAIALSTKPDADYQTFLATLTPPQSTKLSAVPPVPPLDTSLPKAATP